MKARLIAVCGSIGSGKSVVCRCLRVMGYQVYDTDSEARKIMDEDADIHSQLIARIHPLAVKDGQVDRKLIAGIVFENPARLAALNEIVHHYVREHLNAWRTSNDKDALNGLLFVETALLYESGLDRMVDEVWEVTARSDVRVERVMARNGMSREDVLARIEAQNTAVPAERKHPRTYGIDNNPGNAVLPVIELLLGIAITGE